MELGSLPVNECLHQENKNNGRSYFSQNPYTALRHYPVIQPLTENFKTVLKVMKSKGIRRILALSTRSYYVHPPPIPQW